MNIINAVSLLLEVSVVLLGFKIALVNKKYYGWLIALTFTIYVVYDLSRFLNFALQFHNALFLLASMSILWAAWILAWDRKK